MEKNVGNYSKVKSIEEDGFEDVYCISVPETGCFVANGMVIKNCDALRYVCASHKINKPTINNHNPEDYKRNRFDPNRGR